MAMPESGELNKPAQDLADSRVVSCDRTRLVRGPRSDPTLTCPRTRWGADKVDSPKAHRTEALAVGLPKSLSG